MTLFLVLKRLSPKAAHHSATVFANAKYGLDLSRGKTPEGMKKSDC